MQFGFWDTLRQSTYEYDSWKLVEFPYIRLKVIPVLPNETTRDSQPYKKQIRSKPAYRRYGRLVFSNYIANVPRLIKLVREDVYNWRSLRTM